MEKILKDVGEFTKLRRFSDAEKSHDVLAYIEETIVSVAQPQDAVLLYFSGHGALDSLNKLYLALTNTDMKALDATSLALSRIMEYVQRSMCKRVFLVLDCCYSGAVGKSLKKGDVDQAILATTSGYGLAILTSSTFSETSYEGKEGDRNSVFTKYLLEGLKTGDADLNNDGFISVDELYTYVYNNVRATRLQTPVKFNLETIGDLILASNKQAPFVRADPNSVSEDEYAKFYAVKSMIEMLYNLKDPPIFMVALLRYYIEEEPYMASGLTVSAEHTPNIRQTKEGFECDAFFEPKMLTKHAKKGKEIVNGLMKVRMKVKLADIVGVAGRTKSNLGIHFNFDTKNTIISGPRGSGFG
jgi:hypothetical protein